MQPLCEVILIDGQPRLRINGGSGGGDWKFDSTDITELRAVASAINAAHDARYPLVAHQLDVLRSVF